VHRQCGAGFACSVFALHQSWHDVMRVCAEFCVDSTPRCGLGGVEARDGWGSVGRNVLGTAPARVVSAARALPALFSHCTSRGTM